MRCWLHGHVWINVGEIKDERLHGCTHYALSDCKCARCGTKWEIGSKGEVLEQANPRPSGGGKEGR